MWPETIGNRHFVRKYTGHSLVQAMSSICEVN